MYSYELTWVSYFNEVTVFIYTYFNYYSYLFQLLLLVSVAMHPMRMPSTRGGVLEWNIDKYSTPTQRSDWFMLRTYVINKYIYIYIHTVNTIKLVCISRGVSV